MHFFNKNKGFTLIEVLIASAVFVTATALIADIFVRTNDTQRRTQGIQATATDARFAFESMAREARLGEIDYDYYGGTVDVSGGETELAIKTTENNSVRFGLQTDSTICPTGTTSCLAVCLVNTCTTSDWNPITPKGVNVTDLLFYIYPDKSPFVAVGSGFSNNSQPRVTMIMTTENITTDDVSKAVFTMQTTVSTRVYKR